MTVHPYDLEVPFAQGQSIDRILHKAGLEIDSPCGGHGLCGQCLVQVEDPLDVPETPHSSLTAEKAQQGFRLACRLKPDTDMTIRIPDELRILAGDSGGVLQEPDLSAPSERINPAVRVWQDGGRHVVGYCDVPETWSSPRTQKEPALYGLAVDLGTTSLAASLISLQTGDELGLASRLNPQVSCGHDVLTRIRHSHQAEGLTELVQGIRKALNGLARELCSQAGVESRQIHDVVLGGNTTMLQICAGLDPSPLGQLPFQVDLEGGKSYPAEVFGYQVHPGARVYVPPISHAFVGSDVSAGLSTLGDFFTTARPHLFIDVGTNGEMALSTGQARIMTSTAAGPAFEGAGLSCGMRAAQGAIERVSTDGDDVCVHVIGDGSKPRGICGSGLIDLLEVLVAIGVVDPSGRMLKPGEAEGLPARIADRLALRDGKPAFHVAGDILVTQSDVRQLQLAKAAIRAGIECLLQEGGLTAVELETISIAGGFGRSLRPQSLQAIGMVPPGTASRLSFVGNTSRLGCIRLLLDVDRRAVLEDCMDSVTYLAVAEQPVFMDHFVGSIPFSEPVPS